MEIEYAKEEIGGWNAPCKAAIDEIVKHLKLSRRWGREGRSLRSLNRHWRDIITPHVTHLHPRPGRMIGEEDLDSIAKFCEVTSVDLTAFLLQDKNSNLNSLHRIFLEQEIIEDMETNGITEEADLEGLDMVDYRIQQSNTVTRLLKLLDSLKRLPRLEELKLKWNLIASFSLSAKSANEDVTSAMAKLTGVSRLSIDSQLCSPPFPEQISIFSVLPIQEIRGWVAGSNPPNQPFLFPSLRKAWIDCCGEPNYISKFESLRMKNSDSADLKHLSNRRALEGLEFIISSFSDMEMIMDLTHLKDLSLYCQFDEVNTRQFEFTCRDAFSAIKDFHELESLQIRFRYDDLPKICSNCFEELPGLKSICLWGVSVEGAEVLRYLRNLETLILIECKVCNGNSFFGSADDQDSSEWNGLRQIKELEIREIECGYQIFGDDFDLSGLSKMSRLESFVYRLRGCFLSIPIGRLEPLARCRSLRNLEVTYPVKWDVSCGRSILLSLGNLDALSIEFCDAQVAEIEDLGRATDKLKEKSPWMALNLSVDLIYITCEVVEKLEESLEKAKEFIDLGERMGTKMLTVRFEVQIGIRGREKLERLSLAAKKFDLLKNSPGWMFTYIKIDLYDLPRECKRDVKVIVNKIKTSCTRDIVIITDNGSGVLYQWPEDKPY